MGRGHPLEESFMSMPTSKSERYARWMVPLGIVIFALVAIYFTTTFKKMPPILKRGIQPSDFPQLICGFIIFLTALMVWLDPIKLQERADKSTFGTFLALFIFCLLVQIDLFIALGAFAAGLSILWGERRWHLIALVGLAMPTIIFFLFDLAFRIRFPRGLLTNWWYD